MAKQIPVTQKASPIKDPQLQIATAKATTLASPTTSAATATVPATSSW